MTQQTEMRYLPPGLPGPEITDLDRSFWKGTTEHRLMIQACGACGQTAWPPEEICGRCHSTDRTWLESVGTGKIFSWTRIWHPVHPALASRGPYLVVVVKLDDYQLLMIGNLLGPPDQHIEIGEAVEVVFEDVAFDYSLVQWRRRD